MPREFVLSFAIKYRIDLGIMVGKYEVITFFFYCMLYSCVEFEVNFVRII